jgi:putative ABC transport system ATP-binding protein
VSFISETATGIPAIELKSLIKTYYNGDIAVPAVAGIELQVASGEFVAVMGSSGSGKSTLMNLLGCLDRPTSGKYLLEGAAIADLTRKELAVLRNRKIGFIFQNFNLLARTSAIENVELPLLYSPLPMSIRDRWRRARDSLERVGLSHRLSHLPSQLSGGQQQRVAIARALVNQPTLLLADEPTGNLDSRTGIEIMVLFQVLNDAGITIIMVTHELNIARFCKRIITMGDGHILADHANTPSLAADELDILSAKTKISRQ